MQHEKEKILVVFSRADATHRKMLEGILHYAHDFCASRWQVFLDQRDIYRRNETELNREGFSGIIAAVGAENDRQRYLGTGLPTVLFEPMLTHLPNVRRPMNVVTFINDHAAEGRAAADYFLTQGYRTFAFVGTPSATPWSREREHGFVARLAHDGFRTHVYKGTKRTPSTDFARELPTLSKWLSRLPPHTALLAAHDERALQVLAAAASARIQVPTDLAVLGVDDDELLCSTSSPALSSIPVDAQETGERFARALHALLEGRRVDPVVRTCHTRVTTRQSTDAYASGNPIVSKALDYLRRHLGESVGVDDLAAAANCSRRTLEMKMRAETGWAPAEAIYEIRQAEAIKLLSETSLRVNEIALRCGYRTASHLASSFRQHNLPNPLALRKGRRKK